MPLQKQFLIIGLIGWTAFACRAAEPEMVIADFEGSNYGDWKATGQAFGSGPAQGTLPSQMEVSGYLGHGLVNSFNGGDDSVGTLTSPEFTIRSKYITFLIGGGGWAGKTCLNLSVAGKTVRVAVGSNTESGGSEALAPGFWDVSDLNGKSARLEIVDAATGTWGHINVDQIVQTDRRPTDLVTGSARTIQVEKRYLNLPVKNGAPKRRVSFLVDGKAVREFEIELADANPDFWVFLDLAPFQGKEAVIKADTLPENSRALALIEQTDQIKSAGTLYHEALRPQFHFSARRGWLNDPNGLVFYRGEYHLFFQHNPYGWNWGNMHWGHAVSPDLVHWTEQPIALYPQRFDDWAFSGSAVMDRKNSSGFKKGKDDVLVAAYTSTGRGECIVYSNDRGRTFDEYSGNPVIKHSGRDPRLFWHEPTHQWVMAVYDELVGEPDQEKQRGILFYTSPDLKQWTYQSRIAGFFECPDIFELSVDGQKDHTKWVLTAASSDYMIGQFDGKTFTPETSKLTGHRGTKFYAAQTYSDIPAYDGRRIQIGWSGIPTTGMPFNQMMAFPCELTLRTTPEGVRLCWQPVREIAKLYGTTYQRQNLALKDGESLLPEVTGRLFDIQASLAPGAVGVLNFIVGGVPVTYDATRRTISCAGQTKSLPVSDGKTDLRILADRTSLEIYGSGGLLYMPMEAGYVGGSKPLEITAKGGTIVLGTLTVHELNSAWK